MENFQFIWDSFILKKFYVKYIKRYIDAINSLIPSQASSTNQLADKTFVTNITNDLNSRLLNLEELINGNLNNKIDKFNEIINYLTPIRNDSSETIEDLTSIDNETFKIKH